MTTPNGPVLFNSSTGDDSAASGIGPGTPVSGTGASTTASSAVVTGITTTGVNPGDLLWIGSSSGRQFSIIASVDSGTQVTCDNTFSNTESGRNWAIGGKRATFNNSTSRFLFGTTNAISGGLILETETDQSLSSSGIDVGVTNLIIRGLAGSKRVINQSANTYSFRTAAGNWSLENLKFTNTNGTKTAAAALSNTFGGSIPTAIDCIFGDATNQLLTAFNPGTGGTPGVKFLDCIITACTSHGVSIGTGGQMILRRCRVHGNGGGGIIQTSGSSGPTWDLYENLIYGNAGDGIAARVAGTTAHILRNHIYNNNGDGISCDSNAEGAFIARNVIGNNYGGWGISIFAAVSNQLWKNAFYSNSSGEITGSTGVGSITLSATPWVDAASGDFNINNTAGGGALLRAATGTIAT